MKKFLALATLAFALVLTTQVNAQKFNGLDKSPMDMATYPSSYKISEKTVRVTYSRPQLKGRSVAQLAPSGEVWRTGANEATEITFYKEVKLAGETIKPGTYALFTIPGEKEWTIILNSKLNQWGAYTYDKDSDVARVNVTPSSDKESLEAFSISFNKVDNGAHLVMGWGKTRVAVPITL
ncbi:DUF2911 domain-containing protein [uncultured Maribacter sp.]|uniref:DUF2911 domain-containing protein n=1 Tax=uncultured Maribacter sp. TaxID=431308 RepID=UPI002633E3FA|nr:DUF2911 domain-containing protein [uncultured Maribacter sp.]